MSIFILLKSHYCLHVCLSVSSPRDCVYKIGDKKRTYNKLSFQNFSKVSYCCLLVIESKQI